MKRCKVCRKKPRLERRVNNEGVLFCSDDCYDDYDHSPNDMDHPYIDDYEAIRFVYIDWMENYEDDLYKEWLYGTPRKEELMEQLDEFLGEFMDYYGLEGRDGVFSAEIYHYVMELEQLKVVMKNWKADEKVLNKRRKAMYEERKRRKEEEEIWG
ncbi:hypothetical protein [Salirhabdus salicampi]|uniref:hypothetical protein n=1 Tax=Salirhabdus salicampi TaxID=476102 RepID=UPI0020C20C9E|nr:hypothetical protein [Salirhabdus salicampi]MCP8615940.1 hypothetical protein [Salirhabdus salicampi]